MSPNLVHSATNHLEHILSRQEVGYTLSACHCQQGGDKNPATTKRYEAKVENVHQKLWEKNKKIAPTCKDDGDSILTSPSSSFTWTVTPKGTLPGGYNAHLLSDDMFETQWKKIRNKKFASI